MSTVLVVEDDTPLRTALRVGLRARNLDVVDVATGEAAIESVDRGGMSASLVERAKEFMAAHSGDETSLLDVARECGLSRGYFSKAFKTTTGLTPHQWRQCYRIDQAKAMLQGTAMEIAEIAMVCGFADQSHLTRVFTKRVGESPGSWRRMRRSSASTPGPTWPTRTGPWPAASTRTAWPSTAPRTGCSPAAPTA